MDNTPIPLQQECTTNPQCRPLFPNRKGSWWCVPISSCIPTRLREVRGNHKMFTDAITCREPISFPQKFVSSLRTQHNKHTSVRIWYDEARTQDNTSANFCVNILQHGWEWKEYQTTFLLIIRPLHECNTILTNQRRIRWQCGQIYIIRQLCAFNMTLIGLSGQCQDALEN